ncbi:GGDEF domain-containing protein [Sphingomonas colocasiae]|uniref:diguanylate cyclase n=1 Tax=Sphingomonas colocasiae TaxID=1848973 RepID=A0ABS7PNS6_9SPHN|nr:GGDEF domain-containing protein [Sphingomonas colocasiae]MBY8822928.1 GGDEF domain-containing protein [Sphingomonas colocasiae]
MNLPLVNLAVLLSVASIMCVALTLAWLYFGRQRYAQLWALSAAGAVVQWSVSALARIEFPDQAWPLFITGTLVAVDSALIAIGARHRARLPLHLPIMIGIIVLSIALMAMGAATHNLATRGFVANCHAGVMFVIAAAALYPRGRPALPPEFAVVSAFALFALFQFALAALSLGMDSRYMLATGQLYRDVLVIGLPAVYAAVGMAAVFVLAMDLNDRLRALTTRDPLTGALNRRGLEQVATNAFADARRRRRDLAVVLCAIDGYDDARRLRGQDALDGALAVISDVVHASVREEDLLARTGQAEFCLLLIDATPEMATEVVERARQEIASAMIGGARPFSLTVSFGITGFRVDDIVLSSALARADAALCRSIADGGNRVTLSADLQ